MDLNTQRCAALLSVLLLAVLTAACGGAATPGSASSGSSSPSGSGSTAEASDAAPSEAAGAFPVTIEHKFGESTIEQAPERVVSVGFNDHDTILALGTVPVAAREWYGEYPSATWPWAQDALGGETMEVLSSEELDFEQIAGLRPDLIVGIFSGMTEKDYDLLAQIAPTIAAPDEYLDYGTPWRDVTRIYGDALGVPDRAEELIADIDAQFAAVQEENPAFTESEAVVAFYAGGELGAYVSSDLRSRLLTDLGFAIPEQIDEAAGDGAFYAPLSLEQADLIDTDTVLWITATAEEVKQLEDLKVRKTLDANAEGREVFIDFELGGAYSFSSPLSIPYFLDGIVPELQAAADGDPSTPVPSVEGA